MKRLGIVLLLLSLLASNGVKAQSGRLKKADMYYAKIAYAVAAEKYERLRYKKISDAQMLSRLADCYYQIGNTEKAEEVYRTMIDDIAATPEDYYQFAQALKENTKYEESQVYMMKFCEINRADFRAIEFMKNKDKLDDIFEQGDRFTIKNLDVNTEYSDFGGYPKPNNDEVFFMSNRNQPVMVQHIWTWNNQNFLDIYSAQRGPQMEMMKPKMYSEKVNTRFHEGPLCFTPDGTRVFFTRNNTGRGPEGKRDENGIQNLKMYYANVEPDGKWTKIREVPFNNREYSVGHPALTKNGDVLFFVSDMPGGIGGSDIYRVEISDGNSDLVFGTPLNMGFDINTEGQEMFPFIDTLDNMYFSSDGHTGIGGLDVFMVENIVEGNSFAIRNVGLPVNSSKDDFAFILDKEGTTGYFSSNRIKGKGGDDIYSFEMTKPWKKQLVLKGLIVDAKTRGPIPGANIELRDRDGNIVGNVQADINGAYSFPLEEDINYVLEGQNPDYFKSKKEFNTVEVPSDVTEIVKNLELEKDPGLGLYCLVTEKGTGMPLPDVSLKIVDLKTQKVVMDVTTPITGDAMKALTENVVGDCLKYQVVVAKKGYLGKTVPFNYCIKEPGIVNMQESLDLTLQKLEVGMDLAKLIDIQPIYFDLNKYNIRPDAERELAKIVQVMAEYPTMEIELGSHTDCRGSYAYNENLSDQRAKSSAEWVRSRIDNPARIYGKGFGEAKLVNDCACEGKVKSTCSDEQHQQNRRTEFIIIKM